MMGMAGMLLSFWPLGIASASVHFEYDAHTPLDYVMVVLTPGTLADPQGAEGTSYHLAQMLMRGTRTKTKAQLDEAIDLLGSKLEVEIRPEAIVFRGNVLHAQLSAYLQLIGELLTEPAFSAQELEKLKAETLSELLDELNNDRTLAQRHFERAILNGHPYSRPLRGNSKTIPGLTIEGLQEHYRKWFQSSKATILAIGGAKASDFGHLLKTLQSRFSVHSGSQAKLAALPPVQFAKQNRIRIVSKPDRTQIQLIGGMVGVSPTDPRYAELVLANHVFGGDSFSSRLSQEFREKRGWSYASYSQFQMESQPLWSFWMMPTPPLVGPVLKHFLSVFKSFVTRGLTPIEFEHAQKSLVHRTAFQFNTVAKRMEKKLLEFIHQLPKTFFQRLPQKFKSTTLVKTNQAVQSFFKDHPLMISVVGAADEIRSVVSESTQIPLDRIETIDYKADY